MKKIFKSSVLLGILCGGMIHASFEFRSPLSLDDRGYWHWLLSPIDEAWWYDLLPSQKKHTKWNTHAWGAAYTRSADKAFFNPCHHDKVTRHTTTLSELFFGETTFIGENAFAGGTFAGTSTAALAQQALVNNVNPFISFARISPVFNYTEKGAHMGVDAARKLGVDDRFHVGVRAYIPFKIIEVEQENSDFEETLEDVFVTRILSNDGAAEPTQIEYAMRFDFLSSLVFQSTLQPNTPQINVPVVRYLNPGTADADVTITGILVSNPTAGSDTDPAQPPHAYATKRDNGTIPVPPFSKLSTQVAGALGSDGQGGNNTTLFFQTGVDYAGNLADDRAAQSTLFIVPHLDADGTLSPNTQAILNNVAQIVGGGAVADPTGDLLVSEPASAFFLNNGIDLSMYERIVGIGDLVTEVYGGLCSPHNNYFADGIFALKYPTGKRQENSNRIFYKPTGNNGHVEVQLGVDGGWRPRNWFAFEIYALFSHACKRTEHRAAPFLGATVINVGPQIDAKVSWNYFILRTDLNFFHPQNPDFGVELGYELFAKGHDHVKICQATATDLLGRPNQPLDAKNLERHTNSLSNKLRAQIFHRWNSFELFGGGSQIIAGRNMMKETEGFIGFVAYF